MCDRLSKLCFLLVLFDGLRRCMSDDNEVRLMRYLMTDYDAAVRPAQNSSLPLTVVFGVSLHHIIDVDEKNQILTTNCWITQIWFDHHLRWNSSDFAGIKVIRIPYNRVWRPDLILYNNADPQFQSAVINTNVIVSDTGEVVWLSHGIYRSSCDINVEYFPFDLQSCHLKWASWTYDGYQVELVKQTEEGDVSNYQANGEFDLLGFSSVKHIQYYSCCPEPYPDITYTIHLRRRPLFYVFNLILPCILINGIALLVFYVPSESGEKVTLGISALLSMTVFLMTIRETLPPTEKTPLISMYYGVSICLVSFASGLSVVTLNIYHRGVRGAAVPGILKNIVLEKLAPLVFMRFENNRPMNTQGYLVNSENRISISHPLTTRCSINIVLASGGILREKESIEIFLQCLEVVGISKDNFQWDHGNINNKREISPTFLRCSRQEINPQTGTRLDCPWPLTDKRTPEQDGYCLHHRQQRSPRFLQRSRDHDIEVLENQIMHILNKVHAIIDKNEKRLLDQDRRELKELEWKQTSIVLDRLLFAIFLLITIISTTMILCRSPPEPT